MKVPRGNVIILGDGNFSFARSCCAQLNPTRSYFTGYDGAEQFQLKYKAEGQENVNTLRNKGFTVLHSVDATNIRQTSELSDIKFDLIIFNFPHPGGKTNLRKCRQLLKNTFISCAEVLTPEGQLLISLAVGQSGLSTTDVEHMDETQFRNYPNLHNSDSWQLAYLASYGGLVVSKIEDFADWTFPGYNSSGFRSSSRNFNTIKAEMFTLVKVSSANLSSTNRITEETSLMSPIRPYYTHDISFWCDSLAFDEIDFVDRVKKLSKNLVKFVYLLDRYHSTTDKRESRCYRLIWSATNYSLTKEDSVELQLHLRSQLTNGYSTIEGVKFELR